MIVAGIRVLREIRIFLRSPAATMTLLLSSFALVSCNTAPSSSAAALASAARPEAQEYVIGPGDVLNVFVHRSPELSAEVPVRPDGRLSLPLVPNIEAA